MHETTPATTPVPPQAPAGLASRALRPAVELLTQRPATVGELVSAGGVSRRGIEALLNGWRAGDTPGLDVDAETWSLNDPLRSEVIGTWGLEQPQPAGRFLEPEVRTRLEGWARSLPRPRRELDHRPATHDGVAARLDLIDRQLDLRGANVLVLGARDLDALALAADGRVGAVAALDVDDAVLAAVGAARLSTASPTRRWCDVRVGLPASLTGWADLVVTDPPYTPAGMAAFLAVASAALAGPQSKIAVSYGFGETRATLGWQVQREMLRADLALCAMWPGAVTYDGAEAIGGRADLYLLAPTGRDGNHTEAAHNLYTQGPAAARSATEPDSQPADIANKVANDLARADSATTGAAGSAQAIGVRRLLGGEQAPKLQVGAVPVVDLRGDPGGWLPRVLLALQSQAAVLVCDVDSHDRSPDPAPRSDVDGRGWVEAHLRAHWRLTPADRATDGADLLVARRIDGAPTPPAALADDASADRPQLPPLVGRGHANPRNVIAEWLTRTPDPEARLTRRQARVASSDHLASLGIEVRPGDSLIDLPLDAIAALLADPVPG